MQIHLKQKMIKSLVGDIGIIAVAIVHLVIGKYYSTSIPPLAFVFLSFSLMWLILGIVRLQQTLFTLEVISIQKKQEKRLKEHISSLDNQGIFLYNKKRG